jgi:hypothetical protein
MVGTPPLCAFKVLPGGGRTTALPVSRLWPLTEGAMTMTTGINVSLGNVLHGKRRPTAPRDYRVRYQMACVAACQNTCCWNRNSTMPWYRFSSAKGEFQEYRRSAVVRSSSGVKCHGLVSALLRSLAASPITTCPFWHLPGL